MRVMRAVSRQGERGHLRVLRMVASVTADRSSADSGGFREGRRCRVGTGGVCAGGLHLFINKSAHSPVTTFSMHAQQQGM